MCIKSGQDIYYIDGKKTMALCVEVDSQGKKYNVVRELELISMCSEPGGEHVTHLEPEGGPGNKVSVAVLALLSLHKLEGSWQIVWGHSTAVNPGK